MNLAKLTIQLALALLGLAQSVDAQIHVPGDHDYLQDAIDAASPGDVILVSSSFAWQYDEGVIVDKPLTILGDGGVLPMYGGCDVSPGCTSCPVGPRILLQGPGSGTVTIGNLRVMPLDCFYPAPAIRGGGFDEVHLFDVEVTMASGLTGTGHGGHAIDVDVPFLLVTGCDLRGVGSGTDHCEGHLIDEVYAGISNPGGTVMVVDSVVRGGSGDQGFLCCIECDCPTLPSPTLGGDGGPGIVATEVFVAGSTVEGGIGSTFFTFPGGTPYAPTWPPTACGKQVDGPAFEASAVHVLEGTLGGPSVVAVGGAYALAWDLPGPAAFLFAAFGAAPPVPAAAVPGYIALDPASVMAIGPIPTGASHAVTIAVPPAPILIGVEVAFQALDATLGVTRPAVAIVGA